MAGSNDEEARPSTRSERGLDWLNFFIANVQTGFGPFVALYLTAQGWPQGEIGLLLTTGTLAGIASQMPGGALTDAVRRKRLLIGAALGVIAAGALIFAFFADPAMIFAAELLHGGTSGFIKPGLAAIGLGLVGHRALARRLGRNHRFDAFGNALTAALMGVLGQFVAPRVVFLAAAALCLPAVFALTRIRGSEIDYARARSARAREKPREVDRWHALAKNPRLLVFILSLVLFQFANASILPLATERLTEQHGGSTELVTAALVVVPQLVTALIAAWVARRADDWGRRPILILGFLVLPLRAALIAAASGPWLLIAIQPLGGITAAMIGVMTPLVIADVTRGSGRYNLAQGSAGMATGIGASLSTLASGFAVQHFGYTIGLLGLAVIGAIALGVVYGFLPETRPELGRGEGDAPAR